MSDILANVSVVLGAEISAFRAGMAQARRELRGVVQAGEAMKDVGRSLSTYVTAPLLALGAGAVAASGKIESLRNALTAISTQDLARQGTTGVAALGEAAVLTKDRMKELEVLARQPGLGFEQAVQGDVRLRAVGISAEQSAKSLKAFANAIATTGGGKSEFDRVTVQLAQLSAKGKVLAQDLRPIIEAAPAVSAALQKLYGTVDSEEISKQLQKQGQSSTDFIAVLTHELGKIPTVAGGLKNSLENMGDTVTLSLAKIGDGISRALNLPAVLAGISDFVTRIGEAFNALSPGAQRLAVGLGVAVAATGPLLLAFGAVLTALPSLVAGFGILTGAIGVSLGPIALGAAAVAAAAYLIIDNWGALTAYFAPTGEGGRIFKDLAASVSDSVGVIAQAFASLGSGDNLGGLVSASQVFKALFKDLAVGITAFSDVFGGAIGSVVKLLRGDFSGAADEAQRALFGLIDPLANLLGFSKVEQSGTIDSFFKLRDVLIEIDEAAGNASLRGGDLAAALGRVAGGGLLERLREQVKALKEALDTEPTERAIAADNRRIESLEKEIDRLEKLGKSSKALAELQKALSLNDNLSRALGTGHEYLKGKLAAVETGIKNLLAEGWNPYSKKIKELTAESERLRTVLGDNAQLAARVVKGMEPKDAPALTVQSDDDKGGSLEYANGRNPYKRPTRVATVAVDTTDTKASLTEFQEFVGKFQVGVQQVAESMANSLAGAFSGIAGGIGEALANGQSAMQAFGDGLLKAFGQLIVEFGEKLILLGIGNIAAQNYAVGAAQLAAGGLLVGAGAYVGASGLGGGSKGNSTSGANASTNYSRGANNVGQASPQRIQVEVVGTLKASGADLAAALRTRDYRNLRTK